MKAELIYLWINQDGHGCFHQEGFNFSPRYRVSYNQDTKRMIIDFLKAQQAALQHQIQLLEAEQR